MNHLCTEPTNGRNAKREKKRLKIHGICVLQTRKKRITKCAVHRWWWWWWWWYYRLFCCWFCSSVFVFCLWCLDNWVKPRWLFTTQISDINATEAYLVTMYSYIHKHTVPSIFLLCVVFFVFSILWFYRYTVFVNICLVCRRFYPIVRNENKVKFLFGLQRALGTKKESIKYQV